MKSPRRAPSRLFLVLCAPLAACPDPSAETGATASGTGAGPAGNTESSGIGLTTTATSATSVPTSSASTVGTDTATGTDTTPTTGNNTNNTSDTGTSAGTTLDTTGAPQTTGTDTGDGVLDILPKDVVIEIIDGVIINQPYTATYNGVDVTPQVAWSYNKPEIGEMMADSTFVPTGEFGGTGLLKATYLAAQAETNASVKIIKKLDPGGLEPGFGVPVGPDPSMTIVYPYNETVFPLKVAAPVVQWNGVQNDDQYKLHISEQFYDYTIFFTTNTPARHLIDAMEWIGVSESGQGAQGDPIQFELQRKSGGNTYESVLQTWRMAQARLPGRVYYWELPAVGCGGDPNGRVLSIKPSEAQATQFFQPGGCWGCHTVSRDGRTVAAVDDNGSPFPTFTVDVSQDPAVYGNITPNPNLGGSFSAFNQDGTKLLQSNNGGANNANTSLLRIIDGMNSQILNPDVLGVGCGEPAWSPDGTKIAATCGYDASFWTFDASNADLVIADVNPDGISVSNKKVIVSKVGDVGRPAYPNFSPGNEWIVFGRPTQGSRSTGNGKLYLVGVEGNDLVTLDKASTDNKSFNPTFAPLRAGGYFWVVFMTRRDYGNTLVGANRQQLWITAINDPPTGGDPSNPPFYVRGQDECGLSENAYFAPDPCIEEPNKPCESGIDCCSGHCIQMGEVKLCGEKGPCSEGGNACESDADCCEPGTPCLDGYCQQVFPQ